MERLTQKEIRFVIDALVCQRDALQAKIDQGNEDAADDMLLYDSLVKFFQAEAEAEAVRSKAEAAEKYDTEKVREGIRRELGG